MTERSYPSKLLLFGEYAVIEGGEALAIPYPSYSLRWVDQKPADPASKKNLIDYLSWLKQNNFSETLDLENFENDLDHGVDVESNIPAGYGLGSSGAVVAAVYDRYCKNKINVKDLVTLKSFLGSMENYFHLKSSGLDPLVSYLQAAVHATKEMVTIIPAEIIQSSMFAFELIDTGKSRDTSEMIERFNEMMGLENYRTQFMNEYLPLVKKCISAYLGNNMAGLKEHLNKLSTLQMTLFSFAIPSETYQGWIMGLMFNKYYKLCGAGGGGYMICFTEK